MKFFTSICLAAFFALPVLSDGFTPVASPNPWVDDYTPFSGMENWKNWGVYNVHDPACRKVGAYYYMYSTDAIYRENRKKTMCL